MSGKPITIAIPEVHRELVEGVAAEVSCSKETAALIVLDIGVAAVEAYKREGGSIADVLSKVRGQESHAQGDEHPPDST